MKLRTLTVIAALGGLALAGSACAAKAPSDPVAGSSASQSTVPLVDDATAALKVALEKTAGQDVFALKAMMSGQVEMNGKIDRAKKIADLSLRGKLEGEDMDADVRIVDGFSYMKYRSGDIAAQMKGKWLKIGLDAFEPMFDKGQWAPEQFLDEKSRVERVSPAEFKITDGKPGEFLSGVTGADSATATGTVTIKLGADGFVSSVEIAGASQNGTITFSGWGESFTVEAPPAKDTVDGSQVGD